MDLEKYLLLLVILCLEDGETGGHGEKHHDHVNVHVPEFIHHDHHTKVITIHHHHHKPKKEHHHHHHHHKPHIPHGHHYHHHQKKAHTSSHTESKGHHGHHGHKSHGHHGHKSHGHHGHHGHKSHGHGHHHHDTPSYEPPSYQPTPSFESDFGSFTPSVPAYGGSAGHQIPHVHGVTHTVKQVKVFDSLPGVIPHTGGNGGYEVTENGDDGEEDVFTSINGLQQSYPATYGYLRGAAEQPSHDPFAELTPQSAVQTNNHDPFAGAVPQPSVTLSDGGSFPGNVHDPFSASDPSQNTGLMIQPSDFPAGFQADSGLDEQPSSFAGTAGDNSVFLSNDDNSNDAPVSFSREAGIQHAIKTGGVETLVY